MTCGKPLRSHTCNLPSRVLWIVTHFEGWAPTVVIAVIRDSSSSVFLRSFFTMILLLALRISLFHPVADDKSCDTSDSILYSGSHQTKLALFSVDLRPPYCSPLLYVPIASFTWLLDGLDKKSLSQNPQQISFNLLKTLLQENNLTCAKVFKIISRRACSSGFLNQSNHRGLRFIQSKHGKDNKIKLTQILSLKMIDN